MIYNSSIFSDVRFFLAGFSPQKHLEVKMKLVSEGGVYCEEYSPECTHVIVDVGTTVYDDPICVASRRDGKTLVTSLWVNHSLDSGAPAIVDDIMYRPLKDLNGIPGADKLLVSLTGFQGVERDDIKTMVSLMGAQFSKAMVAKKVTHLICYKFEGEKYELAKRMGITKIVNQYWLENCLRAWKILPEEHYSKSTYEVQMMEAEVKDSEDEAEDNIGENSNGVATVQTEIGEAHHNVSTLASTVSIPTEQKGAQTGFPSTSGNAKSSGDFDDKLSLNDSRKTPKKSSPLSSRKTPQSRASLPSVKSIGKSGGRPDNIDMPTFNLETDMEKAASGCIGEEMSEKRANFDAGKHCPPNSKASPRRSTVPLQSNGELTCLDGKEEKSLAGKVIADVSISNSGLDQGKGASPSKILNTEAGLSNEKDSGGLLPRKRTTDGSDVSHTTPKSQKLGSSASKRVDAAEPKTAANSPLNKRKSSALKSGNQTGDESTGPSAGRPSPNKSSAKSNAKDVPSRSLAFNMLQSSKPTSLNPLTSPNSNSVSNPLNVSNNNGQLQNLQNNGAASSDTNEFEAVKSGSLKPNAGDQTGDSISKPSRKKTVARKTLGSRPKASERKSVAQTTTCVYSMVGDAAMNREELAPTSASAKAGLPPSVDDPVGLQSHLVIPKTGENSGQLLHETDEAGCTASASVKKHQQGMPVDGSSGMEQKLEPQKKGRSVKHKKETLLVANKDPDEAEIGKSNDRVKEPKVGAAAKKKHVLLKNSKKPVQVENENEFVCDDLDEAGRVNELACNDQHAEKGVKRAGKSALSRKHGTLPLNKSEGLVVMDNENEPVFDSVGQNDSKKYSEELAAMSNTTQGEGEVKVNNDPGVCNDQGTSKAAKCPKKLAGKKRRGTLLLDNSDRVDEVVKENEPVVDGEQHPGKLTGSSGILDSSMDGDEENGSILGNNKGLIKGGKLAGKKRRGTLQLNKHEVQVDEGKQNESDADNKSDKDSSKGGTLTDKRTNKSNLTVKKSDAAKKNSLDNRELKEVKNPPRCFILSGHRLQRKEFQKLIKDLKGKVCRDSHQWSYQASHFIVPDPIRRTEKFFAAAASGSWILKTDYLAASNQAGKLLPEEPYEWHKNGLSEDGAISLEAPRKWRLLRERTGHGAFYGMQIVIYGECIAPPLDTLKRAVKAGDGTILATSPPYSRFLESGVDFAIVSPGMPRVDVWIQEFLRHQIPCVLADYLVEYVCKPGYSLDRHVQYNTHEWAAKSHSKLLSLSEEVVADAAATPDNEVSDDLACQVCGSTDRGEVMLVCGDETGSSGCGTGYHIDCCAPPLEDIPEEDWFCPKCSETNNKVSVGSKKKASSK